MTIRVAIIGYGYWGPNLVRNFSANPECEVVVVADPSETRRAAAKRFAPNLLIVDNAADAIAHPDIDLVAIATPVATHAELARLALDKGRHIIIEKPMTASVEDAIDLVERARKAGRHLFVDHTFLFTDAVKKIADLVKSGEMGSVCYYDSVRVNLGLFQPDVNVLWDLAPHDLSIIDQLFQADAVHVSASGYCHVNPGVPDMCYLTLHYPGNRVAHLNLSWMSPVKVRRVAIGGTKRMLIWNDLDQDEKIKIYNAGIEVHAADERTVIVPGYRTGDVLSPRLTRTEALGAMVSHVVNVIRGKEVNDLISGERGLRIVRKLEQAQKQLDAENAALSKISAEQPS